MGEPNPMTDGKSLRHNAKLADALTQLHGDERFKVFIAALKAESDETNKQLIRQGATMREYERGEVAGRVQAYWELLDVSESAPAIQAVNSKAKENSDG